MEKFHSIGLTDKYRSPLLVILMLIMFSVCVNAQTFNPSAHVVVNDAIGQSQAAPIDSRSMFWDGTNFIYRPYQNITEVKSYLNLSKYRSGNFIIVVDSGGALQSNGTYFGGFNTFWMFKDGTADANLVEMNLFIGGGCSGCLLAANNLSDLGNLATALTNLNLNNVNNTSDATKNSATAALTNKTISGLSNTITNIPNSSLQNNAIGLSITNTSASDISVTTTPAALGTSLGINIPTASGSQRGALSSTDWATFNGKQNPITLTVVGTSGPATFIGSVLNIPQYTAGTGCTNCNADSLKHLPVDTTSDRNAYVLTFDSTNHKWYLSPNGSGTGITQLTGDGTAGPGSGTQVFTLATVNGTVGTFGNASSVAQVTLNGKGLATAAGSVAIQIAESQVTGLVSDLAGKISTTLPSADILVGNGSNVATAVSMSGDVGISNTGLTTIQPNAVTLGKMATNTANTLLGYNGSGNAADVTIDPTLSLSGGVLALNLTHPNTWTGAITANAGIVMGSSMTFAANNTYNIGSITGVAAHMWARVFESEAGVSLQAAAGNVASLDINAVPGITLLSTGQGQFNNYITPTSFTGTPTSVAEFDAAGDLIQGAIGISDSGFAVLYAPLSGVPIAKQLSVAKRFIIVDTVSADADATVLQYQLTNTISALPTLGNDRTQTPSDSLAVPATNSVLLRSLHVHSTAGSVTVNESASTIHGIDIDLSATGSGLTSFTSPNSTINIGGTLTAPTVDVNPGSPINWTTAPLPSVTNTTDFGNSTHIWNNLWGNTFVASSQLVLKSTGANSIFLEPNGTAQFSVANGGQPRFNAFTSTTAFTGGTPLGLFSFDASGIIYPIGLGTNLSFSGQTLNATGGGSVTLTHNATNDSIQVNGVTAIQDNDNPYNNAAYHMNNDKHVLAALAKMLDTTSGGPVVQVGIGWWTNSFGNHLNLMSQHFVNLLDSKFKSAGPGYVSTSLQHYGMTNSNGGFTLRSSFTSPIGKGIDGQSAISSSVGQTITLAIGGAQTGDYSQWTDYKVFYWALSGGGTFSEAVDGVVKDTINTATGSGFMSHTISGLTNTTHSVVFKTVTEGTAHNEILGWYLWQSGTSGWVVDPMSESSTTMTNYTVLDSATTVQELAAINPTLLIIDNTINDIIANEDTVVFINKLDTLLRRVNAAIPNSDIMLYGPTNYGSVTWGTPTYPVLAYTRQIYRTAVDSGLIFYDPIKLFGSFAYMAQTLMISSDSIHPTAQGSEAWCSSVLSQLGILTYQPPPFIAGFYGSDGIFTNIIGVGRDVNVNNKRLYWDSVTQMRFLGGTGLPTLTLDLTNTNLITFTGSKPFSFSQNLSTAGNFTASATTGNNTFGSYVQIGPNATSNSVLSIEDPVNGYTQLGILSSGVSNFSNILLETTTATGDLYYAGNTFAGFGDMRTANSLNLFYNAPGPMNFASNSLATTGTLQPINFLHGGSALTNLMARFTRVGNFLVSSGDSVDKGNAKIQALSTSQAQYGAYYSGSVYTLMQTASTGAFTISPTGVTTIFTAPTASAATINLPVGTYPTSPNQGDLGAQSGHLYYRDGSTTYDLLAASTGATSVGSIGGPFTNAGSISGGVLTLGVADGSHGGIIAASGSQTLNPTFTFTNAPILTTSSVANQVWTANNTSGGGGWANAVGAVAGSTFNVQINKNGAFAGASLVNIDTTTFSTMSIGSSTIFSDALNIVGTASREALQRFIPNSNGDFSGIEFASSSNAVDASLKFEPTTGEFRLFTGSGSNFPTFYSNNAEFMRGSTTGDLLVGATTDNSNGKVQITGTGGKVLALNGLTGPPSTYAAIVHSTASDSGTYQIAMGSGTYTPTLTNTTNISSSSLDQAYYTVNGKIVTVTVTGTITPTTALLNTQLTFTLPFTTTLSGAHTVGSGAVSYSGTSPELNAAAIVQVISATTASFFFAAPSTAGSSGFATTFQYTL